jgi:hypothetical protein
VFESVTIQHLADGELPKNISAMTRDEDAWLPH